MDANEEQSFFRFLDTIVQLLPNVISQGNRLVRLEDFERSLLGPFLYVLASAASFDGVTV